MNFNDLNPDQQRAAHERARAKCIESLMSVSVTLEPGTNEVSGVNSDIGPINPERYGELFTASGLSAPATLAALMLDDDLRQQFCAWVDQVAGDATYVQSKPPAPDPEPGESLPAPAPEPVVL